MDRASEIPRLRLRLELNQESEGEMALVKHDDGKITVYQALDRNVLVVARFDPPTVLVPEWAAYIGAVPGDSHAAEWQAVADHGTKIDAWMGGFLFAVAKAEIEKQAGIPEGTYRWRR
jgi:hypothetical protein